MTALRLRPAGLLGRIIAILLIAMAVELISSTILYERANEYSIRDDEAKRLGEHLVIARQLLEAAPPARRDAIAATLSTDHYETGWSLRPPPRARNATASMRREVIAWEPSLASTDLRLRSRQGAFGSELVGGLTLGDGSWLSFRTRGSGSDGAAWWTNRIVIAALLALIVTAAAAFLVRVTVHPLRRLARAADRFGSATPQHVVESGPTEVRQVIAAFNRMQSRIQRLIDEQTQGLAAVAHDLRTPLSRMRLRTDRVDSEELRTSISDDIAEMEAMLASLFAFLDGERDPEPPARTDVAVLCATIADDAADHGHRVDYRGPDHCEQRVRRLSLKRAITNLVENALRHGSTTIVSLDFDEQAIVIAVEDDGPGIPADAMASAIQPFVRLDSARQRNTIGHGLGLAIVARVVAVEGGTFTLSNRPEGGLRAEMRLPRKLA